MITNKEYKILQTYEIEVAQDRFKKDYSYFTQVVLSQYFRLKAPRFHKEIQDLVMGIEE